MAAYETELSERDEFPEGCAALEVGSVGVETLDERGSVPFSPQPEVEGEAADGSAELYHPPDHVGAARWIEIFAADGDQVEVAAVMYVPRRE